MERVPIYILAGGRSSRFGSDKARALIGGKPLIVRIAKALEPAGCSVVVVADRQDKYADLGLHTIADQGGYAGPMRGLHAALAHWCGHPAALRESQDWLLLCSCDLLDVRVDMVSELMRTRRRDSSAVAFRNDAGCWEPLFALYHRRLLEVIDSSSPATLSSLSRLLDLHCTTEVQLPSGTHLLQQINTREQLEQALESSQCCARRAT